MTGSATASTFPLPVVAAAGYGLAYLLVAPVATLCHELGHAAVALVAGADAVRVQVGTDPSWRASVGRLTMAVDLAAPRQLWYGRCDYAGLPDSTRTVVAFCAAGPAASAAVLAVLVVAIGAADGLLYWTLVGGFWWTAVGVVATVVPMRYPAWFGPYEGLPSDGRRALDALGNGAARDDGR